MNPRRVHELMRQHFPPVRPELREWVIVADAAGLRHDALRALLDLYIHADAVLVSIHRKTGNLLPETRRWRSWPNTLDKGKFAWPTVSSPGSW